MTNPIKTWYFKAGESSVKLLPVDCCEDGMPRLKDLHRLLNCHTLDATYIHTHMGVFSIWYNDLGLYEDFVFNKPASQVLGKLPIRWSNMNGNYLVMFHPTGDLDTYLHMPSIGFKLWIQICTEALHKQHERARAMRAEMTSIFGEPHVIEAS